MNAAEHCSPVDDVQCVICQERSTLVLYEGLSDVHYGGPGSFSLMRCCGCGLVWLSPRPDEEAIKVYYGDRYIPYRDRAQDQAASGRGLRAPLRRLLSLPYKLRYGRLDQALGPPKTGATMLDVGCGAGQLLELMRNLGWDVWGIEMDPAAASRAAARAGGADRVFVGSVSEAEHPEGSFDLITASHVLEHLHDPLGALRAMSGWLRPGGLLRIWVPNLASTESRVFGRCWSGLDVPRHLFHFSPATISRMLELAGLEVQSWGPQFQGSSFGASVEQTVWRLVRRVPTSHASGPLYKLATPVGWVMCGLGSSAAIEVRARVKERKLPRVLEDGQGHRFRLEQIDCPTCGPGPTKKIGVRGGRFHRYGLGITSTILRCESCSLLFPDPFPFPLDHQALYDDPESYFSRHPEEARIAQYRALVHEVIARSSSPTPSLLDVGSGRGDLLHAARLEGLTETVGLEFAGAMVEHARKHHGIELLPLTLEEYHDADKRLFDAVILNALIEHVYDPDSLMRCVASVLRPGGVLYLDTPREPNLLTWVGNGYNKLLRREAVFNLSPTWPPYHVFGFNPKSLRILLEKHGFRVQSIRVHNDPRIHSNGAAVDRVRSFVGTQILRIANVTGTSSNMFVWAKRA